MAEIATGAVKAAETVVMPKGSKTLAWALMIATGLIAMYWMTWFMIPGGQTVLATLPKDTAYLKFENAFPVADTWLAVTALVSSIQLFRGKPNAIPWLFMAAGAGMYLGGMDMTYDLENGVYSLITQASQTGTVTMEMAINVATLALSFFTMGWAMKNRKMMCQE